MDSRAHRSLALLSIRPHFAEAILTGRKKVELRRTGFVQPISHVVVYATAPISRVVGVFEVVKVDRDRPTRLWRRYRSVAGVEAEFFRDYYKGLEQGIAIVVGSTERFAEPLPLSAIHVSSPPQSYRYLDAELMDRMRGVVPRRDSVYRSCGSWGMASRCPRTAGGASARAAR